MAKNAHRNECKCLHFFASSFVYVGVPVVSSSLSYGRVCVCVRCVCAALSYISVLFVCLVASLLLSSASFVLILLYSAISPSAFFLHHFPVFPIPPTLMIVHLLHAFPRVYSISLFFCSHSLTFHSLLSECSLFLKSVFRHTTLSFRPRWTQQFFKQNNVFNLGGVFRYFHNV